MTVRRVKRRRANRWTGGEGRAAKEERVLPGNTASISEIVLGVKKEGNMDLKADRFSRLCRCPFRQEEEEGGKKQQS